MRYRELLKQTTHLQPVPRSRMVELYFTPPYIKLGTKNGKFMLLIYAIYFAAAIMSDRL
jgi:hypothetical protein